MSDSAYFEGELAARRGATRDMCLYPKGSDGHRAWNEGWVRMNAALNNRLPHASDNEHEQA